MWNDVRALNAVTGLLLGVLALALLGAGLWWLAQRSMFTLTAIRVEGTQEMPLRHVNASTIRATALPRLKGNFFTADLEAVREAFERAAREGEAPVLVTSAAIRPFVRSLVERFRAQTTVLSQAEIHPRARLKTVGSV